MWYTPTENAFIPSEEKRIKNLAYYGEFFANLDFDDGFKTIAYKALERYILSLNIENVTFDLSVAEISTDISNNVRLIIESQNFWESTAQELQDITTALQADFFLTPIIQSYPFELDDKATLPIEIYFSEEDKDIPHRYIIQKAQADIYILEKQLSRLKNRVKTLQNTDRASIGALIQNWNTLIPQIEDKINNQKIQFQRWKRLFSVEDVITCFKWYTKLH